MRYLRIGCDRSSNASRSSSCSLARRSALSLALASPCRNVVPASRRRLPRALALGACGFGARHLWDRGQPPPLSSMRERACRRGPWRMQFAAPDVSVSRRARAMHHVPGILRVLQREEAHAIHRQLRRLEVRHDEDPAFADVNELASCYLAPNDSTWPKPGRCGDGYSYRDAGSGWRSHRDRKP